MGERRSASDSGIPQLPGANVYGISALSLHSLGIEEWVPQIPAFLNSSTPPFLHFLELSPAL
jgi:hypothetical protein